MYAAQYQRPVGAPEDQLAVVPWRGADARARLRPRRGAPARFLSRPLHPELNVYAIDRREQPLVPPEPCGEGIVTDAARRNLPALIERPSFGRSVCEKCEDEPQLGCGFDRAVPRTILYRVDDREGFGEQLLWRLYPLQTHDANLSVAKQVRQTVIDQSGLRLEDAALEPEPIKEVRKRLSPSHRSKLLPKREP